MLNQSVVMEDFNFSQSNIHSPRDSFRFSAIDLSDRKGLALNFKLNQD